MGVDVEPPELGDGVEFAGGLGWGGGELSGEEVAEVLAGLPAFGVEATVDGHREAVAAGVGDPCGDVGEPVGAFGCDLGLVAGVVEQEA